MLLTVAILSIVVRRRFFMLHFNGFTSGNQSRDGLASYVRRAASERWRNEIWSKGDRCFVPNGNSRDCRVGERFIVA